MDMDGTLLNHDGLLTQKNREALIQAQEKGIKIVLASGRTHRSLTPFGEMLKMKDFGGKFICANGVMVMDVSTGKLDIIKQITPEEFKMVYDFVKPFGLEVCALYDTKFLDYIPKELMEKKKEYCKQNNIDESVGYAPGPYTLVFDQRLNLYEVSYLKENEYIHKPCNKIVLAHEPEVLEKYYPLIKEYVEGKMTFARTRERWYEMSPLNIDKGKAIEVLQKQLRISKDETMVFGDGENDLTMFDCSTYSVSPSNGMDFVKEKAFYISTSNDEDTVANALEHFGII